MLKRIFITGATIAFLSMPVTAYADSKIDAVKKDHFVSIPQKTIGKVLEENFDKPKWWVHAEGTDNEVVIFQGEVNDALRLKLVKWTIAKFEGDPKDTLWRIFDRNAAQGYFQGKEELEQRVKAAYAEIGEHRPWVYRFLHYLKTEVWQPGHNAQFQFKVSGSIWKRKVEYIGMSYDDGAKAFDLHKVFWKVCVYGE